jgi:hypothetical protein
MNAFKVATAVAFALLLNAAAAMADAASAGSPSRTSDIHRAPARAATAPVKQVREINTHKAPPVRRNSPRNQTTDLELPQLG